jgi:site-specific recombinase XerD
MLDTIFRRASVRERIESNPLGAILQDYVVYLVSRRHRPGPLHQYVFAVEHFGRWVGKRPIDDGTIEVFIRRHLPRCRCSKPCPRNVACVRAALRRLLEMLGVKRQPADGGGIGTLLAEYESHLRDACGLAEATITYRRRYAREFVRALGVSGAKYLGRWSAEDVRSYVGTVGRTRKPSSGQVAASSIRSFLRFLLMRGLISRDLAAAVPSFANWRLASLPEAVDQDDLRQLIAVVDQASGIGKRDRAVLLCMTELGLRAVEVASLTVDAVDLEAGILHVRRPKQRDRVDMPMSRRLAAAIRSYMRKGRPASETAALFVKHRAPLGDPLKPIGVRSMVVRRAFDAGLADRIRGTHVIRHSIATTLINAGAPMKQIADLLGHRSIDTTTIYAKVDLTSLRKVALPWPTAGGEGVRS